MRRGTTPTITVKVRNADGAPLDISDQDDYYLTFREVGHGRSRFDKTELAPEVDGDCTRLTVTLTQEETLSFRQDSKVEVQLRSKKGEAALATTIASVDALRILKEGVI